MKLELNAIDTSTKVYFGHLRMGGTNPNGQEINANNRFFTIAGKPVLPVMGEFHFSRYPRQYWEEEILKMKACGINIVASYIFWIHHEEIEGRWDWTGDKDLRHFVELCAKHDLYFFPRIGPFSHGECRNGGLPDRIWEMSSKRTDDPVYLTHAKKFYTEIFNQLKGLLYKDGGPIIGIQVENEYWLGKAGEKHMVTLKNMVRKIGFDVPLYMVTGWQAASIPQDKFIPVFSAYADLPWELHVEKLRSNSNYFFQHIQDDSLIDDNLCLKASDYNVDFSRYPYAACEIGPGIEITYHRRPVLCADDVCALSMVKLGSGSNLMGYYVFHGGTHPNGIKTTMQEVYGRPYKLDYPAKSYDFQAPIREFGQISESYKIFKLMHLFLNDFGNILAPMISILPDTRPKNVNDTKILRFAARVKDDAGFLFFNNHQRLTEMNDFEDCRIELKLKKETLLLPSKPFAVKKGTYFIWPFNLKMADAVLKYSTAQLLCKIRENDTDTYFFFAVKGVYPEYVLDSESIESISVLKGAVNSADSFVHIYGLKPGTDCAVRMVTSSGIKINIVTLTTEQAKHCWKGYAWGRERVFLTKSNLLFDRGQLKVYSTDSERMSFSVFPAVNKGLYEGLQQLCGQNDGLFTQYILTRVPKDVQLTLKTRESEEHLPATCPTPVLPGIDCGNSKDCGTNNIRQWSLHIPQDALDGLNELFVRIHYAGDTAQAYINGRLVADDFYSGLPWEIGLKRFAPEIFQTGLVIQITPMRDQSQIYLEDWAKLPEGKEPTIQKIEVVPEYSAVVANSQVPSVTGKRLEHIFKQ